MGEVEVMGRLGSPRGLGVGGDVHKLILMFPYKGTYM